MNAPWVKTTSAMDFRCERCGAKVQVALPVRADDWLALAQTFTKTHAKCRARAEKEEK